jgi:hypothetical protein
MQFLNDPRMIRAATWLFWLALAFACIMALLPKPPHTPLDRLGDKVGHILAFAREARWRIVERLCFLGAAIEVVQSVAWLNRTSDLHDWLADCLAIVVVVLIAGFIVPSRGTSH